MPALKNSKHERFAQALARGLSQVDAYEAAGYRRNRGAASRLAEDVSICKRLAELQSRVAARVEITAADLLQELEEARQLARELGQPAAMVSASAARAKILGIGTTTKTEVTGRDGSPLISPSTIRIIAADDRSDDQAPA